MLKKDLEESNVKLSNLEEAKLKAKADKLYTEKEIESLKKEVAHLKDS